MAASSAEVTQRWEQMQIKTFTKWCNSLFPPRFLFK